MFDVWVDEKSKIDYGNDYYEKQRRRDSQTVRPKGLVRKKED
jgi:ribosomal protein S14